MFFPNSLRTMEAEAVRGDRAVGTDSRKSAPLASGHAPSANRPDESDEFAADDVDETAAATSDDASDGFAPLASLGPNAASAHALRRAADEAVEQLIESDPSLVPTAASALLVAPL